MTLKVDIAMAQDPTTPEEELLRLSKSKNIDVRRAVASNPSSPEDALNALFQEFSLEVVENPATAMFDMEYSAPLAWVDTKHQKKVAQRRTTSPLVLNLLAQSDAISVQMLVAANRNAPVAWLEQWSRSLLWNIQHAVVSNPSTPREVLVFLAENRPGSIGEIAQKRLNSGK